MSNIRKQNSKTAQQGISLIIVLILVVVIGLTASSAMRSATSSQRVTNNLRMESMAQQYAEAALRFCEAQMLLPNGARLANLQTGIPGTLVPQVNTTVGNVPAWLNPVSWTGAPATPVVAATPHAAATRVTLTAGQISSGVSTYVPATLPECIVEQQTLPGPPGPPAPFTVIVVTARGFSTDYQRDVNGNTTNGSVVWLQSILNAI